MKYVQVRMVFSVRDLSRKFLDHRKTKSPVDSFKVHSNLLKVARNLSFGRGMLTSPFNLTYKSQQMKENACVKQCNSEPICYKLSNYTCHNKGDVVAPD